MLLPRQPRVFARLARWQLRGNFWQGPFSKDALLENGTKSHNFTQLINFFVTSHFGTLLKGTVKPC